MILALLQYDPYDLEPFYCDNTGITMCILYLTVIDYCENSPCMNRGTCEAFIGGHSCLCVTGVTGYNCETSRCITAKLYTFKSRGFPV